MTEAYYFSWTQPTCDDCWDERHPTHPSPRRPTSMEETCCYCGELTLSGIYVRVDPRTVPHPTRPWERT